MDVKFLILPFLVALFATSTAAAAVQVKLPQSDVTVIGDTLTEISLNRPIHRFRGIPYAQPPVGPLRFRKPVPWKPKEGTKEMEALVYGNQCIQWNMLPEEAVPAYLAEPANKSEDCLYLNVWTPEVGEKTQELRPVMVWIHGGGLYFGSSSFELYNGETLASRADVVVVSINYRVGTLGFFYSDAIPDIPGNQGLWDQALALRWVQDNIRSFGGDPSRVTIFGESAGGWSVSAHLVSPVSRDLYANAILMSGAVHSVSEPEHYVKTMLASLKKAGCADDGDTQIDAKVVQCLEKMDPFEADKLLFEAFGLIGSSNIIKDGTFFPDTPANLLATGNHKKSFNLLLSTVEDEAPFVPFFFPNDTRFLRNNPTKITLEESQQLLASLFTRTKYADKFPKDLALKVYYSGLNGAIDSQDIFRSKISIAYGDYMLSCPTINFAKQIARSDGTSQIYQWYYTAKLGNPSKWMCSSWTGACHTDDLFPLFGVPFRFAGSFHNRERDISNEVLTFIKSFVRTGTPGPSQSEWQPYFTVGSTVIAPYYELTSAPKTANNFKFNLKSLECDSIWNQLPSF